jgi:hypothetical protein
MEGQCGDSVGPGFESVSNVLKHGLHFFISKAVTGRWLAKAKRKKFVGKVGVYESCLAGIRIVGKTFPEVFVDEPNIKLGGYLLVHDSTKELGGSLFGDVRWCGQ